MLVSQHDQHSDGRVATVQPNQSLLYPAHSGVRWVPEAAAGFQHVSGCDPPYPSAVTRSLYRGELDFTVGQHAANVYVAPA